MGQAQRSADVPRAVGVRARRRAGIDGCVQAGRQAEGAARSRYGLASAARVRQPARRGAACELFAVAPGHSAHDRFGRPHSLPPKRLTVERRPPGAPAFGRGPTRPQWTRRVSLSFRLQRPRLLRAPGMANVGARWRAARPVRPACKVPWTARASRARALPVCSGRCRRAPRRPVPPCRPAGGVVPRPARRRAPPCRACPPC